MKSVRLNFLWSSSHCCLHSHMYMCSLKMDFCNLRKEITHQWIDQNCVFCLLFWNYLNFYQIVYLKKKLVQYFRCPVYKFITCVVYMYLITSWIIFIALCMGISIKHLVWIFDVYIMLKYSHFTDTCVSGQISVYVIKVLATYKWLILHL